MQYARTRPIAMIVKTRRHTGQFCALSPTLLSPPRPPLSSRLPEIQLGGLGSAVSSLAGFGAEPQPKSILVHFSVKIWHLVATILMIFLIIN